MTFKEKIVGVILIILGALPFLLKIESIGKAFEGATWILPGGLVYQIVIVVLGITLLFRKRTAYSPIK